MSFSPPALLLPSATLLVGLGRGVSLRAALGGFAFSLFGEHPRQFRLPPALGFRFELTVGVLEATELKPLPFGLDSAP